MKKNHFSRFLKRVRDTQETEISCSACLEGINAYVDLELATGDAAGQLPRLRQHLDQCGVCHDEYVILLDLARLDADGSLPTRQELSDRLKDSAA